MSTSDLGALDPRAVHPGLGRYRDGGLGGIGADHDVVGYVSTDLLAGMPWNAVDPARVASYVDDLVRGDGFAEPVIILFDPGTLVCVVGEGNHRVAAAGRVGLTHVPARAARDRVDPGRVAARGGRTITSTVVGSPFGADGDGEPYWPSSVHPAYLFPQDTLVLG